MTIQELVTLLLTPAAEMTTEDINYFVDNQPTLREVQHSDLYSLASLHLNLKKQAEDIEVPTRDMVKELVAKTSDFLAGK